MTILTRYEAGNSFNFGMAVLLQKE